MNAVRERMILSMKWRETRLNGRGGGAGGREWGRRIEGRAEKEKARWRRALDALAEPLKSSLRETAILLLGVGHAVLGRHELRDDRLHGRFGRFTEDRVAEVGGAHLDSADAGAATAARAAAEQEAATR